MENNKCVCGKEVNGFVGLALHVTTCQTYNQLQSENGPTVANKDRITALEEEVAKLRETAAMWEQAATEQSWPYEWIVATLLKAERDHACSSLNRYRDAVQALLNWCASEANEANIAEAVANKYLAENEPTKAEVFRGRKEAFSEMADAVADITSSMRLTSHREYRKRSPEDYVAALEAVNADLRRIVDQLRSRSNGTTDAICNPQ